tara:strand:+ start:145 stop:300 length:156 start_codon:yes stop_codon:yes gene_type:complete
VLSQQASEEVAVAVVHMILIKKEQELPLVEVEVVEQVFQLVQVELQVLMQV